MLKEHKRKLHLFAFIFLLLPAIGLAQQLEFGLQFGTTNYSGELSAYQIKSQYFRPAGGALIRYNLTPRFALKGSVFFGQIAGADSTSSNKNDQARNLSFRSNIFEFSGQVEFNIIPYDVMNKKGKFKRIIPCVYTGIAVYKYNPLAYYKGEWWELQTLGTEGQGTTQFQGRKKYSLTQLSIPIGIGLKIDFSKRLNFGFEAGMRVTFNDYLDDVSRSYVDTQYLRAAYGPISAALSDRSGEKNDGLNLGAPGKSRGNSANMDWYYYAGFSITYKIQNRGMRCPRL
jgi:hypothetical protein